MDYKKLLIVGLGLTLANAVMADGLTLSSSGIDSPITVNCNGTQLPQNYDMKPNSQINIGWWEIYAEFNSETLTCNFMLDNQTKDSVGSAQLSYSVFSDDGEVTAVTYLPKYLVTISPGQNVYSSGLTLSIAKAKL